MTKKKTKKTKILMPMLTQILMMEEEEDPVGVGIY
jgi:hypothetical protein